MKHILTITTLIFVTLVGNAQNRADVHPGKNAIFVYCGSELPKTFSYRISRKEIGSKNWKVIKELRFPATEVDWEGRISHEAMQDKDIKLPDNFTMSFLWKKLTASNTDDSLYYMSIYPFMLSACGTGWWDRTVRLHNHYQYKIEKIQAGNVVNSTTSKTVSIPGRAPEFIIKPDTISGNGNSVMLDFELTRYKGMTGCRVYRSYYMQNNFERINPLIIYQTRQGNKHMIVMDQSVTEKAQYSYYVVPFDAFGNEGKASATVNVYNSRANTIPALVTRFRAVSQVKNNVMRLSWRVSNIEDIISIDIYKALVYDGYYTRIGSVSPDDTTFLDHNVKPVTTYYYTLVLKTAYGRTYPSARVPAIYNASEKNLFPPSNLRAVKQGNVVKLSWNKVGPDTRGYYLYRAGSFTGAMQPISGIILSTDSLVTFTDSLKDIQQSPVLVYAVASENTSYNISPLSTRVSVTGKVAFMPVPSDLNVMVTNHKIQLFWDNMNENYPQVAGYWIYRRVADNQGKTISPKVRLNKMPTAYGINSFVDNTAKEGQHYFYSLETVGVDTADVSSPSMEAGAIIPEELPLPPGQIRAMNTRGGVLLQWTNPFDDHVKKIRILRGKKGETLKPVKTLEAGVTEWTDKDITGDTVYFYQVVSVDGKGRQSQADEPMGIRTAAKE